MDESGWVVDGRTKEYEKLKKGFEVCSSGSRRIRVVG